MPLLTGECTVWWLSAREGGQDVALTHILRTLETTIIEKSCKILSSFGRRRRDLMEISADGRLALRCDEDVSCHNG